MRAGEIVLLRSIYRRNVRWCWPCRYVGEWEGRSGLYCQPGNHGKLMKRVAGESYLDYWVTDAPAYDYVWEHSHVLRFMREGDAHTVELFWDEDWNFRGWYVNLQAPLRIAGRCFDTPTGRSTSSSIPTAAGTGRTRTTSRAHSSWASSTR